MLYRYLLYVERLRFVSCIIYQNMESKVQICQQLYQSFVSPLWTYELLLYSAHGVHCRHSVNLKHSRSSNLYFFFQQSCQLHSISSICASVTMAEKDGQKDEFCTYAKKKMLTAYIRVLALFPFFFTSKWNGK